MSITSKRPREFKFDKTSTPENVGPGLYNPKFEHSRFRPNIPFGSTTRRELFSISNGDEPGPGYYEPKIKKSEHSLPASFALTADRVYFVDYQKNPSPASYSLVKEWGNGEKPFVVGRMKTKIDRDPYPMSNVAIPGPGEYDSKLPENNNGANFSNSRAPQREPVYDNGIPGPGSYEVDIYESKESPSPFFRTKQKREVFSNKEKFDSYMLEHTAWRAVTPTNRPFGGLTKRELELGIKDIPGPGKYNPSSPKNHLKCKRNQFGTDRQFYPEVNPAMPGPGFYDLDRSSQFSKSGMITQIPRGELWEIKQTPAPGEYETNIQKSIEEKSKSRIQNHVFKNKEPRETLADSNETPGPAEYTIPRSMKSSAVPFPKSDRFKPTTYIGTLHLNEAPGPAEYSIDRPKHLIGGTIPRSSTVVKKDKRTKHPGPGQYGEVKCEMYRPSFNTKLNEK